MGRGFHIALYVEVYGSSMVQKVILPLFFQERFRTPFGGVSESWAKAPYSKMVPDEIATFL